MQTMMATCFLLLLVATLASSRPSLLNMRTKRDVGHRLWTISASFAECSAICGAGFKIRSVRCLDEDGVIASDCSPEDRPSNYKFCNQINCTTGEADTSLYPDFGTYSFDSDYELGASGTLNFLFISPALHMILLVVMERDRTQTMVEVIITPNGTFSITNIEIIGAVNSVNFIQADDITYLSIMEENVFEVSDMTEDFHVSPTEGIVYQNSTVSGLDGNSLIVDLHFLYFCDEYRVYQFYSNKVNPIHGPGTLFFSPASEAAIYFTTSNTIVNFIEDIIHDEESGTHTHATRSHSESGESPLSTDHPPGELPLTPVDFQESTDTVGPVSSTDSNSGE